MILDPSLSAKVGPGHWFPQAWASALGEVAEALDLGKGAGPLEVRVSEASPDSWDGWQDPLWHTLEWTPGAGARIWIGCGAPVCAALWRHIGGGVDSSSGEELETFREMLNQAASGAAAEGMRRLGAAAHASAAQPSAAPAAGWAVELRFETSGQDCVIALAGNGALARALNAPARQPPASASPAPRTGSPEADPLDLIREVSLDLAVSFGDTKMRLADVLKLASGAIIELNRSVSDPVELLVNDCVVARGNVVVVDGNYGVRITEIVSRRDRVRSML